MTATITFYTRVQCPLCVEAKTVLTELQKETSFTIEEINIADSDHLTEKYGLKIPVIEINGREVQYGKIDQFTILNYLNQHNQ
ncbi:glutaredoxin family protein [Bacillus aquiflavi]|uniref:Glutaredoxin family protein n=1 Tax=Bacillus aquiflavi TaxID=2672567 RepID=A0A6B3W1E0_9BACI|nr:glutaredoxin family protein [Bacillus aquiflavi]MBA4537067.1 glutaredoxin family protein [Bacillus aquiflavi]NEY81364.1 glutaredoxin family protein [Bacillus aquiflavi]UAC47806.1 glutaredoxin family protein [Bacillus aquiflavi]